MSFSCYFCQFDFKLVILTKFHTIAQTYVDGMPALSSKDRKATLREFYGMFSLVFLGNRIPIYFFNFPFTSSCSNALTGHYLQLLFTLCSDNLEMSLLKWKIIRKADAQKF